MNIAQILTRSAERHGDRPAVQVGDERPHTYAELDRLSSSVADLLRDKNVAPGDRIALMLPNVVEFAVLFYGALRVGAVVVPMNPLLKSREIAHYVVDSGAKILFTWSSCMDEATAGAAGTGTEIMTVDPTDFLGGLPVEAPPFPVVDRADTDTAVILYTSGTTGLPKGAELSHANLHSNIELTAFDLFDLDPDDIVLGGLPLFHVFGNTCAMNAAFVAGAKLMLLPRFTAPDALRLIEDHGITVFEGVPTMYTALLELEAPRTTRLRLASSGGSAMPVEVLRRFEQAYGCDVLEGYGLSETAPVVSFNQRNQSRKPGSIGTAVPGVEIRLVDEQGEPVAPGEVGEIAVRGPNVMKGYWNRPEETALVLSADGWFRTGDLATRDDDGFYFIVDRKKDMLIRGGYNVYPREIEEVLYEHPAVSEAAVVGKPDDHLGQEVAAAVVLKAGASADPDEIREFVKQRVAAYKYPRHVAIMETLPKNGTGKIVKREITI